MTGRTRRDEQVSATREALLEAAERLFAQHGVHAVANRQISEAAGQGNNAAVSYHFGTKIDLVRALARRHAEAIEAGRARMIADIGDSSDVRDWVACAVRPVTEHVAALGAPSWYGRFIAQVTADPALHVVTAEEFAAASPSVLKLQEGLNRCLPDLPAEVYDERSVMTRHLVTQMVAERERALADNTPTPRASWRETANGLIDVVAALWQAPVTREG
ncbi:TetR/AcrR family transcriptional regulator [Streptomyces violaceusniger]|uniref:Regulatory protein TetR n=1 Tax=Streptomyces violaceusniger (strain Tu 4113) TaxID=653045 RepID=G2P4Y1_STRV4|nr:TetR/AcrR family transcriptional regulator [Streptomyces violaceusniger]AEM84158.1 regulatory protein TetR [Streptomyces violaceusniger Tu 4113]